MAEDLQERARRMLQIVRQRMNEIETRCIGNCIHVEEKPGAGFVVGICAVFTGEERRPHGAIEVGAFATREQAETRARELRRMVANIINLAQRQIAEIFAPTDGPTQIAGEVNPRR